MIVRFQPTPTQTTRLHQPIIPRKRIVPPIPRPLVLHAHTHLLRNPLPKHLFHPRQRRVDARAHAAARPHLPARRPHPSRLGDPAHAGAERGRGVPGALVGRRVEPVEHAGARGEAGARADGDEVLEGGEGRVDVGDGGGEVGGGRAGAEAAGDELGLLVVLKWVGVQSRNLRGRRGAGRWRGCAWGRWIGRSWS